MKNRFILKLTMLMSIFCSSYLSSYAQDCTANAGGAAIVCGSTTTLVGGVSGTVGAGNPTWTFISGPATPTIATPNSLTTSVTGMVNDGNYIFQLSQPCGTGTATSQVTITAHPRPASFTAGADITNVCATTGSTQLAGVIPAGFTGAWRSVNIYSLVRFTTVVSTNSQFSSTTVANPTFELINKASHQIDPAYYAILKITSLDGNCSYEDTAIVRFLPNPEIVVPTSKTICRETTQPDSWIDNLATSPAFATAYAGSAGTSVAGTTVTLNVLTQPIGANMTYTSIETRRVYFTGMTVDGTYTFTLTVANSCGSFTTPTITFTYTGTAPVRGSFTVASEPEQWMIYDQSNSGGEVHCSSMVGSTTPETFAITVNPLNPATVTTSVSPTGIFPPGGAPAVSVAGAGTYNRVATVTPPTGGWQVGTYKFSVVTANGSCGVSQTYYIHISDGNRPSIAIPDQGLCYPGTGAISATIPLPAVYKGVVNTSYFQDYDPQYNFSVVSKPAGSATPTYTAANLRNISSTSTLISNLNMAGDYVFRITLANYNNSVGPFFNAEYTCSNATFVDTFTIHVENPVNANAGSDQSQTCVNSISLLGNNPGAGMGLWTLISAPSGSSPVIATPNVNSTMVSGVSTPGTYTLAWAITSPFGGCNSIDTVSFNIISISPDAPTVSITQPICNASTGSITVTAPLGATYQYSIDGINYQSGTTFSSLAAGTYQVRSRIGTAGCVSATATPAIIKSTICGTVFNDANGLSDNAVNGTGATTPGATLYAILYDETTGAVIDVVPVNANGTYTLRATNGNAASVYISTTAATIGQIAPPVVTLPSGWVNTGEQNCGTTPGCSGSDPLANGILSLGTVTGPVTSANFGIEQAPVTNNVSQTIAYPTGGVIPAGWVTANVSGTDPEQGPLNGSNASIVIDTLPENATMYYDGVPVIAGTIITNFNPALLSFDNITAGSVSVIFEYSFIDSASVKSLSTGNFTVNWGTPLPVSLRYFKAFKVNEHAMLEWSTASEQNNKGFEIEKSKDANSWVNLGFTAAANSDGNSTIEQNYSFIDKQVYSGANFYRLKQVDRDGKFTYSQVQMVMFDNAHRLQIVPNPTKASFFISGMSGSNTITITNVAGKVLMHTKDIISDKQSVDITHLPAGMYFVAVANDTGSVEVHKIVKQ